MAIRKEYQLPFPLAEVYAAWVSPDTVIAPATGLEVVPEVGGIYSLRVGEAHTIGVFEQIEPEHFLRYTWRWAGSDEATVIEVEFADASRGCAVLIRHDGFSNPDSEAMHDTGWDSYVAGLIAYLRG